MRLHQLTVTAFGPFAGTERVDFDALADGGLFLFTGATGAGKTSILDAVCFALYGQVPGPRAGARALCSDHAADNVAPEVELEVSLRGRRLRLTRSPQWERPKRRGSGTITQQARVLVQEHTGTGWTTLSNRLDETGQLVGGLLGLSLAQFCQVVLLPQGQFAEFLRADAEKRRELLESLFDTGRFTAVERWLVGRRQESARALDDVDQRLAQVLARVAEAGRRDVPDDVEPAGATAWVASLLAEAAADRSRAGVTAEQAAQVRDAAAAALEGATLVAEAHHRRRALVERLQVLLAGAAGHDAAVAEVAAARAVAPLVPLVSEVARLQLELDEARAAAAEAGSALLAVLPATGTDGAGRGRATGLPLASPPALAVLPAPTLLSATARDHRAEAATLQALAKDEAQAARLTAATDALERRVVELDTQARRLAERLGTTAERRAELEAARDRSAAAAAALAGARSAAETAAGRLAAARRRDELALERAEAADHLRQVTDAEQATRHRWLEVRQARLDGMAAELAGMLVPGDGCPVCGSDEHPHPAQPGPGAVSREEEQSVLAAVQRAEEARAAAAAALAAVDQDLAATRAAAGGDEPVASLAADSDATEAEVRQLQALAANAEEDAAAVVTFAEQHEGWLRERVALDEEARALRLRAGDDRARLGELVGSLAQARGDDPTIAARAARLSALADDLDRLARRVETVDRLGEEVAAALDRAEEARRDRGVSSLAEILGATRDETTLARLEEARRRHETDLTAVREQLAEPVLAALDGAPAPDLDALRGQLQHADAACSEAVAALATARDRTDALERLADALTDVLAEREPLAAQHRTVDALSRLAEGKSADNRLRMSLSGYVLAARLEQVALCASERLSRMSSGRYQLVHRADAGSGRARGGLRLRVLDGWTGVERDPATLSGGESFSASLALALGLADVVTAEAGGTMLETLFVDEGFGSLDDDTLDDVMGVLDGLREGGRTVGIVSHVADLRQRVPVQLRVEKGRDGSRVRQ